MFKKGIIVILFSAFAMADAPINGQVFSFNGNPLAYAIIAGDEDQNWVIANDIGHFNYHFSINIGDTLSVSRYGYQKSNFVISDKPFYIVSLIPDPIQQDGLTVQGNNQIFHGQITNSYKDNIGINNPQNVLQQIPGISIRTYGGKAGIMTISTNGSPTVNTKILLDDIDLTSSQNGETDLSQIPEIFIGQITIANSPGIYCGSGAADGVLRISPLNRRTFISASTGSNGFGSYSGNINKNWSNWTANLSAGYLKDDGNFKYDIKNSSATRANNDFERKYAAIQTTSKFSDKSNISVLLLRSQQKRGVAGSTDWASPEARRNDNLQLGSLTFIQLHENGYSKIQLSNRSSYDHYTDPTGWVPTDSEHNIFGSAVKFQHHRKIWNNITGTFFYDGRLEKLESTDVGERDRKTNSIASVIKIPIWNNFNIIPALRFDRAGNNHFQPTMDLRLKYDNLMGSEIEYHYGTGFRYPTFNDLYWQPGGNPNLEPDKSRYQTIKFKLFLDDSYSNIYLNISDRYTDDLIQWVPIDESFFVWQPQNIASSRRTNITIGSQYKLETLPLQISIHTTYQKTKDIDLDKPLLYVPELIGYAELAYSSSSIQISLNAHYTGERVSSYGYPDDELLASYLLANAAFQYQFPIFGNQISVSLDINNILDRQFETIKDYPEPGRASRIGIKYIFNS